MFHYLYLDVYTGDLYKKNKKNKMIKFLLLRIFAEGRNFNNLLHKTSIMLYLFILNYVYAGSPRFIFKARYREVLVINKLF